MARVESSPPDRPTTAAAAWVCSSRFFSPRADRRRISSQCSSRRLLSSGMKGVGLTGRVRVVVPGSRVKGTVSIRLSGLARKVVMRRRSCSSRPMSSSLTVRPEANRRSASSTPFSAIRLWPENTRSVVDSPSPALA